MRVTACSSDSSPQLIAGPIVRASQMLPQIKRVAAGRGPRIRIVSIGLGLCLIGVVKKVFLSDSLAPFVDAVFTLAPGDPASAWAGAWLFAFQIYFDFFGYRDIALGVAYLLGFRLPLNFRQPYLCTGSREFWRRWHITLSTWIRDYLYIPLGGNRRGRWLRQGTVLILVMGLAGLWHGARWTFIAWGILWGAYIGLWRLIDRHLPPQQSLRWATNLVVVVILWVFFRSSSVDFALRYLHTMLGGPPLGQATLFSTAPMLVLIGCVLLLVLHQIESRLYTPAAIRRIRHVDGPLLWGLLDHGFELRKLVTCWGGLGCNEYVALRK